MGDIHPFITHFPIVLILTAALFQLIYIVQPSWIDRRTPLWLFGLSVISAILSMVSGQEAATAVPGLDSSARSLLEQHEDTASFTVWTSIVIFFGWIWLFFRFPDDRRIDWIVAAFLFLLSVSVAIAGYLGGLLVMRHGVGVGLL
jgi:uncharacterized membrane protein